MYTALRVLQQLGLVEEERRKRFPNTILTSLTERGRKVAEGRGDRGDSENGCLSENIEKLFNGRGELKFE